jgi:poly(3-hydroxybutyrate) depolymerase
MHAVRPRLTAGLWVALAGACASDPAGGAPDALPDPPPIDAAVSSSDGARADAADADGPPPPTPDAADPIGYACAPEPSAGHQEIDCPEAVHMDVEVSPACAAGGCGVILDVHGFTMSGDQEDRHTRMRALAPPLGYVVVQPSAPEGVGLPSWGTGERDPIVWDFLVATIDRLAIDPDRVHVMGFSQGAQMTLRLLCLHAAQLASVAPSAHAACFDGAGPAVEVPILYQHGTLDTVVAYWVGSGLRDDVLAAWDFGPPTTIADTGAYRATRWVTASGTVFEYWDHDFTTGNLVTSGHCLPGPVSSESFRCQEPGQYDHSVEVLRFFQDHPRGG